MSATKSRVCDKKIPSAAKPIPPPLAAKRRILIVDDHPMTRDGLAANLNAEADLKVCGKAGNPAEAMTILGRQKADLMVTDLNMPGRSGIEFIKDVHAILPEMPILVLSMHDEMLFAERALRAGARGYLMKDAGSPKVLEVIRRVLNGESYVGSAMSARLLDAVTGRRPRGSNSPIEKLSDREFEVFRLLGNGKSTKDVARAMGISYKTVQAHRARIKRKLQFKDAPALVHHAVRWVETGAL